MTRAQDLFVSFTVSNLGMYEELGRRTRDVEQGSGVVVFWMELGDVLQVENVPWVPGLCSQPQGLKSRSMQCCSGKDMCYWMLSWSSQVLGTFCARDLCTRDISRV
jgi:hypothetical protein